MSLADLLTGIPAGPSRPCPYLPGRAAVDCAFAAEQLPPELYHDLMDAGFRRNGNVFYRPTCAGCRECVPIRVPTATFTPDRSQRRAVRRNADVHVQAAEPRFTPEKGELYRRYLRDHHGRSDLDTDDEIERFLYRSPVNTLEFEYRIGPDLVGVGIVDVCSRSLSSVYFYFDPTQSRRSLGTYSALYEIEFARSVGIPYYYLGFYIRGCGKMNYKARFRPCELLSADGQWRVWEPTGG